MVRDGARNHAEDPLDNVVEPPVAANRIKIGPRRRAIALWLERLARGRGAAPGPPRDPTRLPGAWPQHTQLLLDEFTALARAATGRGGPADRPTPKKRRRSSRLAAYHRGSADRRPNAAHTRPESTPRPAQTAHPCAPPRSRRTRPSARSGRSRRRWPRTGPSPSGSACARATRSAGTRSGGTGAARSSACKLA